MKPNQSLSQIGICVLGAIDGLLVGLVAEEIRIIYVVHQMRQAMRTVALHNDFAADYFYPSREGFVPFVCIVTFAGISHLVFRYFMNRPQALLLLWLGLGAFTLWAGYFIFKETLSPNVFSLMYVMIFAAVSYSGHRLWAKHPQSLPLLWLVIGVSAVIVVAASVQFFGLFIFQTYGLRSSLVWLLCLAVVVVINLIYGVVIQIILSLRHQRKLKRNNV